MNLLKTIIERLNQRIEVANIFDKQFGLCELNANGNEKAWVHYIGNGQAEVVTNFDAKQGTLFWAKRGKVTVVKTDAFRVSGCKQLYITSFPLTAYAVVRKSHLPCDSEDAQDWLASRIYKITSGTDPVFRQAIGVINYEVVPSGYINEIKTLTANYEWACVSVDFDIQVITTTEDGCYDICQTGDIPIPDLPACTPCLTEVAVDGVTITGNGTAEDPLVAIGGGGGGGVMTAIAFSTDHLASTGNQYVIGNVVWYINNIYRCIANNDSILPTNTAYWTNLGGGFQTIERPIDWNATSGNNQILNKPTIPSVIVESVSATSPISSSGGTNPDISITQADGTTDGYLSQTDWNTFDGKFDVPTGLVTDYLDGLGAPTPFPAIPTVTPSALTKTDDTNVTITLGGSPTTSLLAATSLTMGWSGTLADVRIASAATWNGKQNAITTGTTLQYFRGDLSLDTFPTALPPSGAAGGDLSGTYPNPEVHKIHGIDMQSGTPTADDLWIYGGAPAKWQHGKIKTINSTTLIGSGNITTGTVTSVAALTLGTSGTDLSSSVANGTTTPVITLDVPTASAVNRGALSAADWSTFNAKQNAITLTTTGTSGAATLTGATLNIPQYSGGGASNYKSTTDGIATSTANNTLSQSQLITAGTFATGDIIRIHCRLRATGIVGTKTMRIYVNATNDLTAAVLVATFLSGTNSTIQGMKRDLVIKSATNTETFAAAVAIASDDSASNTFTNSNIDWSTNKYIIFAVQRGAAGDTLLISSYLIEKL